MIEPRIVFIYQIGN